LTGGRAIPSDPEPVAPLPTAGRAERAARGPEPERIGVVFIAATWRSGSTLLDLMIGQLPGFVSVGELRQLWRKGILDDRPCGCGQPFSRCAFWTAVGQHAFGGWDRVDAERLARLRGSLDDARAVPRLLARRAPRPGSDQALYVAALRKVFEGIQRVSGASHVVDSSKSPGHALLLRRTPGLDLRLLRLVRDPRAVTFSRLRGMSNRAEAGQLDEPRPVNVTNWSLRWLSYNTFVPRFFPRDRRGALVRYEDLAVAPSERLEQLLAAAGLTVPPDAFGFISGDRVALGPNHMVYGNRMRFTDGELVVRLDEEWKRRIRGRDRRLITALTWPMLRRYGYPLEISSA
jgi:hypothetical protein